MHQKILALRIVEYNDRLIPFFKDRYRDLLERYGIEDILACWYVKSLEDTHLTFFDTPHSDALRNDPELMCAMGTQDLNPILTRVYRDFIKVLPEETRFTEECIKVTVLRATLLLTYPIEGHVRALHTPHRSDGSIPTRHSVLYKQYTTVPESHARFLRRRRLHHDGRSCIQSTPLDAENEQCRGCVGEEYSLLDNVSRCAANRPSGI